MDTEDLFSTSPESILIVNRNGLRRLKCPFTVLLIVKLEGLEEGEAYEVRLVLPHSYFKIVYVLTVLKFSRKTEKQWSGSLQMPGTLATVLISILLLINLWTVLIFNLRFKFFHFKITREFAIFPILIFLVINSILFIYNKRFLSIEEYFDSLGGRKKNVKNIFFILYLTLTIALFLTSVNI